MIKKVFIFAAITLGFLEILFRLFLQLPSPGAFLYHQASHSLFNRPGFQGTLSTSRYIDLKHFNRFQSKSEFPGFIDVSIDSEGFRQAAEGHKSALGKGLLILGDSVAFGWPLGFEDSHLADLEKRSERPIRTCSMLAAGPVQLLKVINEHCQFPSGWQQAVVQLTINNNFSFPDSLFIDNLGDSFQAQIAYLYYHSDVPGFQIQDWFSPTGNQVKEIQEFGAQFFEPDSFIQKSHVGRVLYYLTALRSRPENKLILPKLQSMADKKVPLAERHLASLQAIEVLQKKIGIPLKVYLHPTSTQARLRSVRPDVENLKAALIARGFDVYDQLNDPEFVNLAPRYYFENDIHPNPVGYRFIAGKMADLLEIKNE